MPVNTEFQKNACPAEAALPELFKGLTLTYYFVANKLVRERLLNRYAEIVGI